MYLLPPYVRKPCMKKYGIGRIRKFDIVSAFVRFSERKSALHYWEPLFILQLQRWGFGLTGATAMFEWGESFGHNWNKLWPNEEEKKAAPEVVLNWFYSEVQYCSDRMSLDRILRCNWLYHLYVQKIDALKQEAKERKVSGTQKLL